ncbi:MAG: AMP-binding protein [Synergistaceae bacterium]|nr:AMP-binding protein [Synergistaceae bacterium]
MRRLDEIILPVLDSDKEKICYWYDGKFYTRRDMLALVSVCEDALYHSGFSRGQRLVVMLRNSPLIAALSLAVWKLGGIFCPLNEKAGIPSLKGTLELIRPFAVITEHEIPELKAIWPCIELNLDDTRLPEFSGITQETETEDYAVIFATSGTTGNPKAVPLTHENLLSNCEATIAGVPSITSNDTFLNVLPNFHSFGYTVTIILPLTIGAKISIAPSFLPPAATIRALTETKIDVMFVVPAIMSFLLMNVEKGKLSPEALSRIRIICTGGDRLNPNVHELAMRLLGRDVMEGYGLTETSPVICVSHDCVNQVHGSVGPVLPGYDYVIRTREGHDTDANEGVLWVKGPCVTPGYLHAPEITAERFDSEGWFNTGDYVKIEHHNGEDYIFILDRVTDIIIVGGFNVYPQEVEKILSGHPAVHAAVVVGVPHQINGEIPKAYVQLNDGAEANERDIIKYAKEKLAHFKVPRSIEFVSEFPLSGTGKILRRVLRERARHASS